MKLDESKYHQLVDLLQQKVEELLDETDFDIDMANGILTIDFEEGGKVILSRQPALSQLWVAAKSGGYHLVYDESIATWVVLNSQESLGTLLTRLVLEQSGEKLSFEGL